MLHNETTNIWSHLLGAILYIFLLFYLVFWTATNDKSTLKDDDTIFGLSVGFINSFNTFVAKHLLWNEKDIVGSPEISKIPLYIHMAGNIICMTLSSGYHLFYCYSKEMN
mmetsp:Transcript_7052/g.7918  ORF Transcript_7052/g.7918 Transcript_7052/m.7918 type:complete len:110 (+) Transcript_7052:271-600(+)